MSSLLRCGSWSEDGESILGVCKLQILRTLPNQGGGIENAYARRTPYCAVYPAPRERGCGKIFERTRRTITSPFRRQNLLVFNPALLLPTLHLTPAMESSFVQREPVRRSMRSGQGRAAVQER